MNPTYKNDKIKSDHISNSNKEIVELYDELETNVHKHLLLQEICINIYNFFQLKDCQSLLNAIKDLNNYVQSEEETMFPEIANFGVARFLISSIEMFNIDEKAIIIKCISNLLAHEDQTVDLFMQMNLLLTLQDLMQYGQLTVPLLMCSANIITSSVENRDLFIQFWSIPELNRMANETDEISVIRIIAHVFSMICKYPIDSTSFDLLLGYFRGLIKFQDFEVTKLSLWGIHNLLYRSGSESTIKQDSEFINFIIQLLHESVQSIDFLYVLYLIISDLAKIGCDLKELDLSFITYAIESGHDNLIKASTICLKDIINGNRSLLYDSNSQKFLSDLQTLMESMNFSSRKEISTAIARIYAEYNIAKDEHENDGRCIPLSNLLDVFKFLSTLFQLEDLTLFIQLFRTLTSLIYHSKTAGVTEICYRFLQESNIGSIIFELNDDSFMENSSYKFEKELLDAAIFEIAPCS